MTLRNPSTEAAQMAHMSFDVTAVFRYNTGGRGNQRPAQLNLYGPDMFGLGPRGAGAADYAFGDVETDTKMFAPPFPVYDHYPEVTAISSLPWVRTAAGMVIQPNADAGVPWPGAPHLTHLAQRLGDEVALMVRKLNLHTAWTAPVTPFLGLSFADTEAMCLSEWGPGMPAERMRAARDIFVDDAMRSVALPWVGADVDVEGPFSIQQRDVDTAAQTAINNALDHLTLLRRRRAEIKADLDPDMTGIETFVPPVMRLAVRMGGAYMNARAAVLTILADLVGPSFPSVAVDKCFLIPPRLLACRLHEYVFQLLSMLVFVHVLCLERRNTPRAFIREAAVTAMAVIKRGSYHVFLPIREQAVATVCAQLRADMELSNEPPPPPELFHHLVIDGPVLMAAHQLVFQETFRHEKATPLSPNAMTLHVVMETGLRRLVSHVRPHWDSRGGLATVAFYDDAATFVGAWRVYGALSAVMHSRGLTRPMENNPLFRAVFGLQDWIARIGMRGGIPRDYDAYTAVSRAATAGHVRLLATIQRFVSRMPPAPPPGLHFDVLSMGERVRILAGYLGLGDDALPSDLHFRPGMTGLLELYTTVFDLRTGGMGLLDFQRHFVAFIVETCPESGDANAWWTAFRAVHAYVREAMVGMSSAVGSIFKTGAAQAALKQASATIPAVNPDIMQRIIPDGAISPSKTLPTTRAVDLLKIVELYMNTLVARAAHRQAGAPVDVPAVAGRVIPTGLSPVLLEQILDGSLWRTGTPFHAVLAFSPRAEAEFVNRHTLHMVRARIADIYARLNTLQAIHDAPLSQIDVSPDMVARSATVAIHARIEVPSTKQLAMLYVGWVWRPARDTSDGSSNEHGASAATKPLRWVATPVAAQQRRQVLCVPAADGVEGYYHMVVGNAESGWHMGGGVRVNVFLKCMRTGVEFREECNHPRAARWMVARQVHWADPPDYPALVALSVRLAVLRMAIRGGPLLARVYKRMRRAQAGARAQRQRRLPAGERGDSPDSVLSDAYTDATAGDTDTDNSDDTDTDTDTDDDDAFFDAEAEWGDPLVAPQAQQRGAWVGGMRAFLAGLQDAILADPFANLFEPHDGNVADAAADGVNVGAAPVAARYGTAIAPVLFTPPAAGPGNTRLAPFYQSSPPLTAEAVRQELEGNGVILGAAMSHLLVANYASFGDLYPLIGAEATQRLIGCMREAAMWARRSQQERTQGLRAAEAEMDATMAKVGAALSHNATMYYVGRHSAYTRNPYFTWIPPVLNHPPDLLPHQFAEHLFLSGPAFAKRFAGLIGDSKADSEDFLPQWGSLYRTVIGAGGSPALFGYPLLTWACVVHAHIAWDGHIPPVLWHDASGARMVHGDTASCAAKYLFGRTSALVRSTDVDTWRSLVVFSAKVFGDTRAGRAELVRRHQLRERVIATALRDAAAANRRRVLRESRQLAVDLLAVYDHYYHSSTTVCATAAGRGGRGGALLPEIPRHAHSPGHEDGPLITGPIFSIATLDGDDGGLSFGGNDPLPRRFLVGRRGSNRGGDDDDDDDDGDGGGDGATYAGGVPFQTVFFDRSMGASPPTATIPAPPGTPGTPTSPTMFTAPGAPPGPPTLTGTTQPQPQPQAPGSGDLVTFLVTIEDAIDAIDAQLVPPLTPPPGVLTVLYDRAIGLRMNLQDYMATTTEVPTRAQNAQAERLRDRIEQSVRLIHTRIRSVSYGEALTNVETQLEDLEDEMEPLTDPAGPIAPFELERLREFRQTLDILIHTMATAGPPRLPVDVGRAAELTRRVNVLRDAIDDALFRGRETARELQALQRYLDETWATMRPFIANELGPPGQQLLTTEEAAAHQTELRATLRRLWELRQRHDITPQEDRLAQNQQETIRLMIVGLRNVIETRHRERQARAEPDNAPLLAAIQNMQRQPATDNAALLNAIQGLQQSLFQEFDRMRSRHQSTRELHTQTNSLLRRLMTGLNDRRRVEAEARFREMDAAVRFMRRQLTPETASLATLIAFHARLGEFAGWLGSVLGDPDLGDSVIMDTIRTRLTEIRAMYNEMGRLINRVERQRMEGIPAQLTELYQLVEELLAAYERGPGGGGGSGPDIDDLDDLDDDNDDGAPSGAWRRRLREERRAADTERQRRLEDMLSGFQERMEAIINQGQQRDKDKDEGDEGKDTGASSSSPPPTDTFDPPRQPTPSPIPVGASPMLPPLLPNADILSNADVYAARMAATEALILDEENRMATVGSLLEAFYVAPSRDTGANIMRYGPAMRVSEHNGQKVLTILRADFNELATLVLALCAEATPVWVEDTLIQYSGVMTRLGNTVARLGNAAAQIDIVASIVATFAPVQPVPNGGSDNNTTASGQASPLSPRRRPVDAPVFVAVSPPIQQPPIPGPIITPSIPSSVGRPDDDDDNDNDADAAAAATPSASHASQRAQYEAALVAIAADIRALRACVPDAAVLQTGLDLVDAMERDFATGYPAFVDYITTTEAGTGRLADAGRGIETCLRRVAAADVFLHEHMLALCAEVMDDRILAAERTLDGVAQELQVAQRRIDRIRVARDVAESRIRATAGGEVPVARTGERLGTGGTADENSGSDWVETQHLAACVHELNHIVASSPAYLHSDDEDIVGLVAYWKTHGAAIVAVLQHVDGSIRRVLHADRLLNARLAGAADGAFQGAWDVREEAYAAVEVAHAYEAAARDVVSKARVYLDANATTAGLDARLSRALKRDYLLKHGEVLPLAYICTAGVERVVAAGEAAYETGLPLMQTGPGAARWQCYVERLLGADDHLVPCVARIKAAVRFLKQRAAVHRHHDAVYADFVGNTLMRLNRLGDMAMHLRVEIAILVRAMRDPARATHIPRRSRRLCCTELDLPQADIAVRAAAMYRGLIKQVRLLIASAGGAEEEKRLARLDLVYFDRLRGLERRVFHGSQRMRTPASTHITYSGGGGRSVG